MTSPRSIRGALWVLVVVLAVLLAGCGDVEAPTNPRHALHDAGKLSRAAVDFANRTWAEYCPAAVKNGGRDLTQEQARTCLRHGWREYRDALRSGGYDPEHLPQPGDRRSP